jgi:hypothetical protein
MSSHTGHSIDPDAYIVIWHTGHKPQPNFQGAMNGLEATRRTYNAKSRVRYNPEELTGGPKPSINETIWPPADLKISRELKVNK